MKRRMFPILGDGFSIPWDLIEMYELQAIKNHSQSLERLAQRGGLGSDEMLAVIHGISWREAAKRWPNPREALLKWVEENDNKGPGTPTARWERLLEELEKRFPNPEPHRSDRMPEQHYLDSIDKLLNQVVEQDKIIKGLQKKAEHDRECRRMKMFHDYHKGRGLPPDNDDPLDECNCWLSKLDEETTNGQPH